MMSQQGVLVVSLFPTALDHPISVLPKCTEFHPIAKVESTNGNNLMDSQLLWGLKTKDNQIDFNWGLWDTFRALSFMEIAFWTTVLETWVQMSKSTYILQTFAVKYSILRHDSTF